jgi:WD40 repeat protein
VVVTAKGDRAVTGATDGTVQVWDLARGQPSYTLAGHELSVTAVAVTAPGDRAVSASWDGTVRVWDLEKGKEMAILRTPGVIGNVAWFPDGSGLIMGGMEGYTRGSVYCVIAEFLRRVL